MGFVVGELKGRGSEAHLQERVVLARMKPRMPAQPFSWKRVCTYLGRLGQVGPAEIRASSPPAFRTCKSAIGSIAAATDVRRAVTSWLVGWAAAAAASSPALTQPLVVGGKDFTEQRIVVEITAQYLRNKGFTVATRTGFATSGLRTEQELGHVDLCWEYTGTSLISFNKVTEKLEPEEAYRRVKELDLKKGLVWLSSSKVNNTYALAMRKADASAKGIVSISDLAARVRRGEKFRLASNLEFYLRADGLMPLQRTYGFEFGRENVVRMETGAIYDLLRNSLAFDVGVVFSTDGRVPAFGLSLLQDDRNFFPSYILAPVVRANTLESHPELATHLEAISSKLDGETMAALNGMVDLEKKTVEDVAASFLRESSLLSPPTK